MSPRIEPTLEPADKPDTPELRIPTLRKPKRPPRKSGDSLLGPVFLTVLTIAAVVFLPIVALRWLPPPTTAYMLQSPTKPVRYAWVPSARIAEVARRAVIASEDQKFRSHDGFDIEAIEKARKHNEKSKRRRGASTISQQTAKNLFLWPGGGYFRKGVEAGLTVLIESLWTKDRILEIYLNVAEFGPGIYGVEAASRAYFGKPAALLSAGEAARLAAVLPSPRRWKANSPGPYVLKRANWILGQMGYGPKSAPEDEPELPDEGGDEGLEAPPGQALPDTPSGNQPGIESSGGDVQQPESGAPGVSPEAAEPPRDINLPAVPDNIKPAEPTPITSTD